MFHPIWASSDNDLEKILILGKILDTLNLSVRLLW